MTGRDEEDLPQKRGLVTNKTICDKKGFATKKRVGHEEKDWPQRR